MGFEQKPILNHYSEQNTGVLDIPQAGNELVDYLTSDIVQLTEPSSPSTQGNNTSHPRKEQYN